MKEKEPDLDIEYFFTDTGKELPEVYEFLDKIQASYGIKVNYLSPDTGNSNDSPFVETSVHLSLVAIFA